MPFRRPRKSLSLNPASICSECRRHARESQRDGIRKFALLSSFSPFTCITTEPSSAPARRNASTRAGREIFVMFAAAYAPGLPVLAAGFADWLSQSLKRVSPSRAPSSGISVRSLTAIP